MCKTFLTTFKALKSPNFIFLCDACLTKREQLEASSLKEQLASVVNSVSELAKEVKSLKSKVNLSPTNVVTEVLPAQMRECNHTENTDKSNPNIQIKNNNEGSKELNADEELDADSTLKEGSSKERGKNISKLISKASLCNRTNGKPIDVDKFKEIATTNSIQVRKTISKPNGDLYVELPNQEIRGKLLPMLNDVAFVQNEVNYN